MTSMRKYSVSARIGKKNKVPQGGATELNDVSSIPDHGIEGGINLGRSICEANIEISSRFGK